MNQESLNPNASKLEFVVFKIIHGSCLYKLHFNYLSAEVQMISFRQLKFGNVIGQGGGVG